MGPDGPIQERHHETLHAFLATLDVADRIHFRQEWWREREMTLMNDVAKSARQMAQLKHSQMTQMIKSLPNRWRAWIALLYNDNDNNLYSHIP